MALGFKIEQTIFSRSELHKSVHSFVQLPWKQVVGSVAWTMKQRCQHLPPFPQAADFEKWAGDTGVGDLDGSKLTGNL